MAKHHISLGPVPAEEPCAQVGTEGYGIRAHAECKRHIALLRDFYVSAHGAMHAGIKLRIKTNHHDFGDYYDVIVEYDEADPAAEQAALWLDHYRPAEWPDTAHEIY